MSVCRLTTPRSRIAVLAALASAIAWVPGQADADEVWNRGSGSSRVNITMLGDVTSSITIFVDGSVDRTSNLPTVVTGSGTSGFVNFGTYNMASPLLTGEKHRVNSNPKGTYLVATLRVGVILTGGYLLANVDIQRTNPIAAVLDVPAGRLLYARPAARKKNQPINWPKWSKYPDDRWLADVNEVPASSYVPGAGNLEFDMSTGDTLDHQVAIWIPDSAPLGSFSTMVTYTGTAR